MKAEQVLCVVCNAHPARHGGLCCHHRYDDQPPCDSKTCRNSVTADEWDDLAAEWPDLPNPRPADPFDQDGYCEFCGNGRWKYHAPWCKWQDVVEAEPSVLLPGQTEANRAD